MGEEQLPFPSQVVRRPGWVALGVRCVLKGKFVHVESGSTFNLDSSQVYFSVAAQLLLPGVVPPIGSRRPGRRGISGCRPRADSGKNGKRCHHACWLRTPPRRHPSLPTYLDGEGTGGRDRCQYHSRPQRRRMGRIPREPEKLALVEAVEKRLDHFCHGFFKVSLISSSCLSRQYCGL